MVFQIAPQVQSRASELIGTIEQEVLGTCVGIVERIPVCSQGIVLIAAPGGVVASGQVSFVVVVVIIVRSAELLIAIETRVATPGPSSLVARD